jgi:hypothetical protein
MARKYASIDFLRGFAIWMMVFVHTLMRWVDQSGIEANLANLPMLIFVILLAAIFFGGWAGFFLMVSASGNMISMYRNIERGKKVGSVVLKQVIGGSLLLLCAVLTEAVIGYHGYLGEVALGHPEKWDILLWRGFHQETIHTIAWCVILNGVVQGLLSMNGGYKKIKRNIIIYLVLAVILIAATVPIWEGLRYSFPGWNTKGLPLQYPFDTPLAGKEPIQYGYLGITPFWQLVKQWFIAPLAGGPEPIVPFLAVSFIGSVIGLFLLKKEQEKEANPDKLPSTRPLTIALIITFVLFLIGLVGTGVLGATSPDMNLVGVLISHHYDVRALYEYSLPYGFGYSFLWLTWFILETAAQLCAILIILRAVEFRGKAKQFARKTLYFRRFGFVAFSIYNWQFVDIIAVWAFVGIGLLFPALQIPGVNKVGEGYTAIMDAARNGYGPIYIWFLIAAVYGVHQILLKSWEKANFTGGFEWFISKVSDIIIPAKRKDRVREGFFKTVRLDPKKGLYNVQWIEMVPYDKVQHADLVDSKLAARLCWIGLLIPPLSLVSLGIAKTALKTEGKNKYSKRGYIVSIIAICLTAVIIAVLLFSRQLGIPGISL